MNVPHPISNEIALKLLMGLEKWQEMKSTLPHSGTISVEESDQQVNILHAENLCGGTLREMEVWGVCVWGTFAVSVKWAGKNCGE